MAAQFDQVLLKTEDDPDRIVNILALVAAYAAPNEVELITNAYTLAAKACHPQGEAIEKSVPNHLLAAAEILAEMGVPSDVVAAALLVEFPSNACTIKDIEEKVGPRVALQVKRVRHMRQIPYLSSQSKLVWSEKQKAELYHAFVSALESPQPILIELACQLYKLHNLSNFYSTEQRQIVFEALNIYAPLAHRLGIWHIKWQMEDRAFRFTHPGEYHRIVAALNEQRKSRERGIQQVVKLLGKELEKHGIEAEISGRPKHIYSIYRKMKRKGVPLEAVYDIRALRVLVLDQGACYQGLGVVHSLWTPIAGELDDYIAKPKPNGYRSLHTAVVDQQGKTLEVQIRSHQMHTEAELGFAAHWRYKERNGSKQMRQSKARVAEQAIEEKISWLRSLLQEPPENDLAAAELPEEPVQKTRPKELVFVSTPQGDIIRLPAGATPIDFAYRIHTELGHRCYGAKINGKIVPLDYQLQDGNQVEIVTRKRGGPNVNWLSKEGRFIKTRDARKKITAWFRSQKRKKHAAHGHEILDRELAKLGLKSTRSFEEIAHHLNFDNAEELLVQIGSELISAEKLRSAIIAEPRLTREELAREADKELVTKEGASKTLIEKKPDTDRAAPFHPGRGLYIASTSGLHSRLAKCCYPIPPEKIVGFVTRGHGVTIHNADCPNIGSVQDRDRFVSAAWGETHQQQFPVKVFVEALNRRGLMGDIGQAVAKINVDIEEARVKKRAHWAVFELLMNVTGLDQLSNVIDRLTQTKGVRTVFRKKG